MKTLFDRSKPFHSTICNIRHVWTPPSSKFDASVCRIFNSPQTSIQFNSIQKKKKTKKRENWKKLIKGTTRSKMEGMVCACFENAATRVLQKGNWTALDPVSRLYHLVARRNLGSKPANDHANVRLYILIVSSPQNALCESSPGIIHSPRLLRGPIHSTFSSLPFLSPSSPAYSFQTSPRKISFRFFIRFFPSIILPRSYLFFFIAFLSIFWNSSM